MSETPRLQLSSPSQLVDLVPYQLGFDPQDSLVLIAVTDRGVAAAMARIDLGDIEGAESLAQVARVLVRGVPATSWIVAVAYCADLADGLDVLRMWAEADVDVDRGSVGAVVGEWLHEVDGTITHLDQYSPVVAAAVAAGLSKVGSREELGELFASPEPDSVALFRATRAIAALPTQASDADLVAGARDLMDQLADAPADTRAFDWAVQLAHLARTHAVVEAFAMASIEPESPQRSFDLWRSVVRHVPRQMAALPLALAGLAAWADGDGAKALVAAELAHQAAGVGPGEFGMAALVEAFAQELPGSEWASTREQVLHTAPPAVLEAFAAEPGCDQSAEVSQPAIRPLPPMMSGGPSSSPSI